MISKKYNIENKDEAIQQQYLQNNFIVTEFDKTGCSIYFQDKNFLKAIEQIQYVKAIEKRLPLVEVKELLWEDDFLEEEYDSQIFDEYNKEDR